MKIYKKSDWQKRSLEKHSSQKTKIATFLLYKTPYKAVETFYYHFNIQTNS